MDEAVCQTKDPDGMQLLNLFLEILKQLLKPSKDEFYGIINITWQRWLSVLVKDA